MASDQAAKLAVYVLHRHGRTVCATPILAEEAEARAAHSYFNLEAAIEHQDEDRTGEYDVELHLVGSPHHVALCEFRRSAADDAVNKLWEYAFPAIPK